MVSSVWVARVRSLAGNRALGSLTRYCSGVTEADEAAGGLPGRPLESGFAYRPASEFPQLRLRDEARRLVLEKMDSVDDARLKAAETSSSTYIG